MAISVADNFSYKGAKPLDARFQFSTVADMKTATESDLYNGCLAYVTATKKYYSYDSTNTSSADTGKWVELSSGGSGGSSTFSGLSDVSITNILNGQVPKWNSSTSKWENANESGGGGGGGESYSTSEQTIGTWIDGSTLYQRTYDCGALPNKSGDLTVAHNISDLDKIIAISGCAISSSMFFTLPHVANSSINDQITIFADTTDITVRVGKNRSEYNGYVTLRYTKATV